jgi:integrase
MEYVMEKLSNPNHPKKGSTIRVDPIRRREDIAAIKKLLSDEPRNLLLFTMGINNGLRVGDVLKLKVSQVRYAKINEGITIKESKTGKLNTLFVNKAVYKALQNYFEEAKPHDSDWLFPNLKNPEKHLSSIAVNLLVKKWARSINLNSGNYGAHTLRKTFGYIQRMEYKVGFEVLAKRFNHASPAVTMHYLGIEDKEVNEILVNDI